MPRLFSLLLTWCMWILFCITPLWADDITDVLPATFVPITSEAWLTDGTMIVIGANKNKNNSLLVANGKVIGNYLATTSWESNNDESLLVNDGQMVWTLQQEGSSFLIKNSVGYIARGKTNTTLSLSTDVSQAKRYHIQLQSDGTFALQDVNEPTRYLGTTNTFVDSKEYDVFANYIASPSYNSSIRLYRYGQATLDLSGRTQMPDDGIEVVLFSQGYVYDGAQVVDASDYLLSDASVASTIPAPRFYTEVRDANNLVFYDSEGHYVNADLQGVTEEVVWTLRDGTLWQGDRVLRYNTATKLFVAMTSEEVATTRGEDIALLPVAADLQSDLHDGVLHLSGGISATALAQIDWKNAYLLDLTAAQLPIYPKAFTARPTTVNSLILINSNYTNFVPPSWNFCVSQSDVYTLVTDAELIDRASLILPFDIQLGTSRVKYMRKLYGDGGWETLVLPFDADIPEGIKAEKLIESNSSVATFGTIRSITAGTAVLFKPTTEDIQSVTFTSKGTILTTTTSGNFCGTYQPYRPEVSGGYNTLFLHPDGTRFVPASSQNTLQPFRAYIKGNGTSHIRLIHP